MTVPPDPKPSEKSDRTLLLHAHVDGELDAAESLALEQKLADDPVLQAEQARLLALKDAVQRQANRYNLANPMRRRLEHQYGARQTHHFDWRAMAASIVVTAMVASSGTYVVLGPHLGSALQNRGAGVIESIVAGHQRGLLADRPRRCCLLRSAHG